MLLGDGRGVGLKGWTGLRGIREVVLILHPSKTRENDEALRRSKQKTGEETCFKYDAAGSGAQVSAGEDQALRWPGSSASASAFASVMPN
jgi:hypothetical protein